MAILPAAVLLTDPATQWLRTAVPLILQQDLATSHTLAANYVADTSAAYAGELTSILRTVVEQHGSRLRIQAVLTDARTQKNQRVWEVEGPQAEGALPLVDRLAHEWDSGHAAHFSTGNPLALQALTAAVTASDTAMRDRMLQQAVQLDPAFGLAQIALVENRSSTVQALPDLVPVGHFTPLDQARWLALQARLAHRPLPEQAKAQESVLTLAPNNVDALDRLGFQRFLMGDSAAGERLLRKAILLNPGNAALQFELAQGLVAVRRFSDATAVLEPVCNATPALLPELAILQLLNGKGSEGEKNFRKFAGLLPLALQGAAEARWKMYSDPGVIAATLPSASDAVSFWTKAVADSGDTNLPARAMLAASLDASGRHPEAAAVQVRPFLPDFNDPTANVAFNQMRRWLKV